MTSTVDSRVQILEHSVDQLEKKVDDGFDKVGRAIRDLTQALNTKGTPIPFKEIAVTVAIVLGILATLGGFLEWHYAKNSQLVEYRLGQLEKTRVIIHALPSSAHSQ